MPRHHCIITGTGRAGTTFLVQLLTELGLDTGYSNARQDLHANANAGMEQNIRSADAPYIIKDPNIGDYLDPLMASGTVAIDHAFVPMRALFQAAQSRRDVQARSNRDGFRYGVPGGLVQTKRPHEQEMVLTKVLYRVMYILAYYDVPTTLLVFPRTVNDPQYLYRKLAPILGGIAFPGFRKAFRAVARPEMVHRFAKPGMRMAKGLRKPPEA